MIFKGKTTLNKKQKGTKSILVRENLKEKCMGYYSDLRLSITKRDYLIMLEKDEKNSNSCAYILSPDNVVTVTAKN